MRVEFHKIKDGIEKTVDIVTGDADAEDERVVSELTEKLIEMGYKEVINDY